MSASVQRDNLLALTKATLPSFDTVLVIFGLFIAISLSCHFILVTRNENAPPLVKSRLPFLGAALSFLSDTERFLLDCKKQYGDIFTLYMGGKRFHVVCDINSGIPSIFKGSKIFSVTRSSRVFLRRLFGISGRVLDDHQLDHATRALFGPFLLAQAEVDRLVTKFNLNLRPILIREIKKLDTEKLSKDGVIVDLDTWIQKIMFECNGKTLFGETWPSDDAFFEDYRIWDDGVYSLIKNYPFFWTRKSKLARERFNGRLLSILKKPLIKASDLVEERLKVLPF